MRKISLQIIFIILAIGPTLGLLPAAYGATQADVLDKIVAIVNSHIITSSELDKQVQLAQHDLDAQKIPAPGAGELRNHVLERLIDTHLQLDLAKNLDILASDQEITSAIKSLEKTHHLSHTQVLAELKAQGISYAEYKKNIKNQIILQKLQKQQISDKVQLDDKEVKQTLNTIRDQTNKLEEIRLNHILIALPETPSPQEVMAARRKAEDIVAQLRKGGDFAQAALRYSDAENTMQQGWDWGWRQALSLPSVFVENLKAMKPGEISNPFRTGNGFHILKLVDSRSRATHQYVQEAKVRHILLLTPTPASKQVVLNKIQQIHSQLAMGASFTDIAIALSEDPVSASKGGELDWVSPGDLPPRLERTIQQLKIGAISKPIHSQIGWHILQVEARRQIDLAKHKQLIQAKNIVFQKTFDKAMDKWLIELRANGYIKIFTKNVVS